MSSDLEVIQNSLGSLPPFPDGGDHQIRAADHVATGEDLRVAGLELVSGLFRGDDPALTVYLHLYIGEPGRRTGAEAEGDDDRVGRQDLLRSGNRLGAATPLGIRLAQASLDDLDPFDLAVADDFDRLTVEQEVHTLIPGILHFLARAGHVLRVTAVGADHRFGTLTDRGTVAVRSGLATAEHHHALALHVGVGAHAHEHGIVFLQQLLHADIATDLGVQAELDTHAGKDFTAARHHGLFQLELGDTEGQQAADFRVAVEYHRLDAGTYQHVGTTQPGRAGTYDGDPLAVGLDLGHVRPPAHGEGGVGDVLLDRADGNRAEAVIQGTGPLAQTVLRTDATTDFRQGVGLVRQLCRLDDVALGNQLQPVRDVVVYRTLPLAVRVAALQAAVRLLGGLLRLEQLVDLDKAGLALPQRTLLRLLPTHFDKLEVVVRTLCHVPPLHCRCAAAHQRNFIVTQPLTAGWPAWFSAEHAGSLPWA